MSLKKHKIIVGVDLGTTYSGQYDFIKNVNDIDLIRNWPGKGKASDEVSKTPSRIAFANENPHYDSDRWGYEVLPKMVACSWFKLGLDKNVEVTDFDDPELHTLAESEGNGMFRLPANMSPADVCAAYLTPFYRHVMDHLEKRFSAEILATMPIEFWFTVPAIWSDKAKADTKAAAMKAGFASRLEDAIKMIPEPEAAAVAALKSLAEGSSGDSQLKPKMGIMIIDCGGGTVDLTSYKITGISPKLEFEELVPGIGGKCGSTSIDRGFHAWMERVFREHFTNIPFEKKGPGSALMKEFELIKRDFGSSRDRNQEYELTLVMPGVEEGRYYDDSECVVKLYQSDMLGFFQRPLDRITRMIQQQLDQAKETSPDCPITLAILVGGFGDSSHINRELKEWCRSAGDIRLICPEKPQAAIVRGAAFRGLEGIKPSSRRCRRAYGFEVCLPFRKDIDPKKDGYKCLWTGRRMCCRRLDWQILKVDDTTKISSSVYEISEGDFPSSSELSLYSCDVDLLPERTTDPWTKRIGTIKLNFKDIDPKLLKRKTMYGKKLNKLDCQVEVLLGKEEGVLCFRVMCGHREIGSTEITYEN
ncbi:actin-like ATPase domain-containing protein [Rhizodiscina lignyota]|uniref:Actin-like ATPase domain-containing protein n=1 Tax=Rhizodiscina lignyota TaxID=1504668 RepID=A0A9P4MA38_9PEZI|nr:actin-like ATPase domain-containing protein [Rhizodiscina lignyota]